MKAPRHAAEQALQAACWLCVPLSPACAAVSSAAVSAGMAAWPWHGAIGMAAGAEAARLGVAEEAGVDAHARPMPTVAACSGTAVISSRINQVLKSLSIGAQYTMGDGGFFLLASRASAGRVPGFGVIHGAVGVAQQLLHGFAVFRIMRDADTDGDR